MSLEDWVVQEGQKPRGGGQGTVVKVRHKADGRDGALKRLHDTKPEERRYRFLVEVSGLRVLRSDGAPLVLDANESEWRNPKAELFLVMEFIDGVTMSQLADMRLPTLDQALSATRRILAILETGHKLPLLHRDLKSDNVIMRASRWEDPVLVDYGLAWFRDLPNVDYKTPDGKEQGNRFLRLPEFAPGGEHYDVRSDITMAAGLLCFMLTGTAPRTIVDEYGRHPHERPEAPVRAEVLKDPRWPRLSQIFRIAFQQRIESRFQNAHEFARELDMLDGGHDMTEDDLDADIARFIEVTNSAVARERSEAAGPMEKASRELYSALGELWTAAGLEQAGQSPTFKDGGASNEFYCVVSRRGHKDPMVMFRHKIELGDGRFRASWTVGDSAQPNLVFYGSSADGEELRRAVLGSARAMAAAVVRDLTAQLTPRVDLKQFFQ